MVNLVGVLMSKNFKPLPARLLMAIIFLNSSPGWANSNDDCCQPNGTLKNGKSAHGRPVMVSQHVPEPKPAAKGSMIAPADRSLTPLTIPFTVTGEVVDSWCYASQVMGSGRGETHKPCGLACAHGGVTLGIVDDNGKLYIAAKSKAYTGCKELLTPFIAKRVKASGWLATKGGSNIMKIGKVELAK